MLKLQCRDIHSILVLKCSKAVSDLCNGMCSSSWSMEAVMLDFKQVKKQMKNAYVGQVDKLSLAKPLALANIASKFYKILPKITSKALGLLFSINICSILLELRYQKTRNNEPC